MSDIRFNRWLHNSGTGGVYQDSAGNVGVGTSVPTTALDVVGGVSATSFTGNLTGNVVGNVTGNVTGGITTTSIVVGDSFIRSNSIGIGTTDTTGRNAGVGTAVGTIIYNSSTESIQVYASNGWFNLASVFTATGGTESTSSRPGYKVHTFTSTGPFVVSEGTKIAEYLLVAGGGGGGSGANASAGHGGGGAGGVLNGTFTLTPGNYTITVGGGGGVTSPAPTYIAGTPGQPSNIIAPGVVGFTSITAIGGGGGGAGAPPNPGAGNGGSGGGGGYNQPGAFGLSPSTPAPVITSFPTYTPGTTQGRNGGAGIGNVPAFAAGGGGGAGGTGSPAPANNVGGAGGPGNPYAISGTPATYGGGGGGGGGWNSSPNTGGAGGPGGGGAGGSVPSPTTGGTGGTNTGGGGGGGAGLSGGQGGSGIVIIAYPS